MSLAAEVQIAGLATRGGLTILVAEDNEADAHLISHALSAMSTVGRVVCVRDGVEALATLTRDALMPDMAFIDLRMPRMDGFDLMSALAARPQWTFPMVLTSSMAARDAARSRLHSAVRVVTKPDSALELRAVLVAAINAVCPAPHVAGLRAGAG